MGTLHKLSPSFTRRRVDAEAMLDELTRERAAVKKVTISVNRVLIELSQKPSKKFANFSSSIKVIGGPDGLYKIMRYRRGLVNVQWLEPYTHHGSAKVWEAKS